MKTFLSLLSIKTNNFSDEKVVVGLLAVSSEQIFYSYSKDKLKAVSKISNEENLSSFAETILNQIQKKINKIDKEVIIQQTKLYQKNKFFSDEYF
jgi:hypothetical protein